MGDRAAAGWAVPSSTAAAVWVGVSRTRHRLPVAGSDESSWAHRARRSASAPAWAAWHGCERIWASRARRLLRASRRTHPDSSTQRWLGLAQWEVRSRSGTRKPARLRVRVSARAWGRVSARARPRGRSQTGPRALPRGLPWNPWVRRAVPDVEGRRRPLVDGYGRPGRPRWTRTGSRHRCLVSERARATPCSSSRVPSRARVLGSSSAPKRSLTSECVRRAHTQSHILSQPSPVRTSPRTNKRHQAVHVGAGHWRP